MLVLLLACAQPSGEGPVGWAANYATVTPSADGVAGVHVWTFFSEGWENDRDPAWHSCSLLQELEGTLDPAALEGCPSCAAVFQVTLFDIETDCPEALVADEGFRSLPWMAVGAMPTELADQEPHAGRTQGWYLGYDGETAQPHGFAYAEDLDFGRTVDGGGWVEGRVYSLWPAYAWDLR